MTTHRGWGEKERFDEKKEHKGCSCFPFEGRMQRVREDCDDNGENLQTDTCASTSTRSNVCWFYGFHAVTILVLFTELQQGLASFILLLYCTLLRWPQIERRKGLTDRGEGWGEDLYFEKAGATQRRGEIQTGACYRSDLRGSSNPHGPVTVYSLGGGWHKCNITFGATMVERLHKILSHWSYRQLQQKNFPLSACSVSQRLLSLLSLGSLLMTVSLISSYSLNSLPPSLKQNQSVLSNLQPLLFPLENPALCSSWAVVTHLGAGLTWTPFSTTNWEGRVFGDQGPVCYCTMTLLLTWATNATELGVTQ